MGDRDTWTNRDLPVLKAVVDIFEDDDEEEIEPLGIARRTGLELDAVQKSLRALRKHPYFDDSGLWYDDGNCVYVGEPTADCFRAAGNWPSPQGLVDRLIAALDQAGDDEDRLPEERSTLKKTALTLRGAAYQVALGALGGAGGNLLSG